LILINIAGAAFATVRFSGRKATIAVTQALSPTCRLPDVLNCSNSTAAAFCASAQVGLEHRGPPKSQPGN
jgi:hypothetical protein